MAAVEVRGLREFRRELKAADAEHVKALTGIHRDIARRERDNARRNALAGTPLTRRAAFGIGSSASATSAKLTTRPTARAPMANVAFWGAYGRTRSGWNDGWRNKKRNPRRFLGGRPQFPNWVGTNWRIGVRNEGPYVLNYTIAEDLPDIEKLMLDRYAELYRRAFPN